MTLSPLPNVCSSHPSGDIKCYCCGGPHHVCDCPTSPRLLSPQYLFDISTGYQGHYEGDQNSFQLCSAGLSSLIVEYENHNQLPLGYERIDSVLSPSPHPQAHTLLLDDSNQNWTGGQKLLLQLNYPFGPLNLPSVQHILCAVPSLCSKYGSECN
jgi:hypothetical protein